MTLLHQVCEYVMPVIIADFTQMSSQNEVTREQLERSKREVIHISNMVRNGQSLDVIYRNLFEF